MKVSKNDFDNLLEYVGYSSVYNSDDTISLTGINNEEKELFSTQENAIKSLDAKGLFENAFLKMSNVNIPDYQTALRLNIENEDTQKARAISTYLFLA